MRAANYTFLTNELGKDVSDKTFH